MPFGFPPRHTSDFKSEPGQYVTPVSGSIPLNHKSHSFTRCFRCDVADDKYLRSVDIDIDSCPSTAEGPVRRTAPIPYNHPRFVPNMERVFPPWYTFMNKRQKFRSSTTLLFHYEPLVIEDLLPGLVSSCSLLCSRSIDKMFIRFHHV
jgi:hypothetical protein